MTLARNWRQSSEEVATAVTNLITAYFNTPNPTLQPAQLEQILDGARTLDDSDSILRRSLREDLQGVTTHRSDENAVVTDIGLMMCICACQGSPSDPHASR